MSNTDEILRKYGSKIESQIETSQSLSQSSEYLKFKEDLLPVPSKYQRWCLALGNLVKVRLSPKEEAKIQMPLDSLILSGSGKEKKEKVAKLTLPSLFYHSQQENHSDQDPVTTPTFNVGR